MQYAAIQTLLYKLTKTNSTSLLAADMNDFTQPAENDIASMIMQCDGRWQYDDTNQTDTPIATTNLVSGQQDYTLSLSQLRILSISVLGLTGIWRKLIPFDPDDLTDSFGPLYDRAQFLNTPGIPLYYDLQGESIYLYPAPDNGISVTLTAGLKVYYQRGPVAFDWTSGNTTNTPGFNSLYHHLIAYKAAVSYCVINLPELVAGYMNVVAKIESALILDYSKRDKDERQILSMAPIKFR